MSLDRRVEIRSEDAGRPARVTWGRALRASLALVLLATGLAGTPAAAQDYPVRPVRIIVPFSAGIGVDLATRLIAAQLEPRLGQPVSVVNQPGAGGALGISTVLAAPADGYSLVLGADAAIALNPLVVKDTPFRASDLAPVSLVFSNPLVLLSAPQGRFKEIADLRRHVAEGGSVRFGTVGALTSGHIMGENLGRALGGKFVHVPYREVANGLRDLIAGDIEVFFIGAGSAFRQVAAGTFHGLAVSSARQVECLPGVRTFLEQGVGLEVVAWGGLFVAAATPPAIVARLNREINAVLVSPETARFYATQCLTSASLTPAEFAARVGADVEKWKTLLAGINLQPDR